MPAANMSRVLNILHSLYPHVQTLGDFADGIVFREGRKAALIEQDDASRFVAFVQGVFVCTDKTLQQVPSCKQICTLSELLAFVLNNMKRKRKRNVLAHGYGFLSLPQEERDADQFKFQSDVTQSASYIHGSDLWKKISNRLGTDVTRYLLESCGVFVSVPPSCVFQLCGVPVYDRVSMATMSSDFYMYKRRHRRTLRREKGKLKRKRDPVEEEAAMTCTVKKRCVEGKGSMQGAKYVCIETNNAAPSSCVESAASMKLSNNSCADFKQHVELPTATLPTERGPSWRSGLYPPLPLSQCFIRTLGMLYSGRGMRGFLLNRKKNTVSGPSRLQGQDLVRVVFFEGVAYLNGVERKPKKLPKRFFNMVPLFRQLLRRHRRCPYSRILQKLCIVMGNGETLSSLLPKHCAPHRVYLFVRECLATVVPQEMWGSDHNRITFLIKVKRFLLSGKLERLSLAEVMWHMKVNDCDWLKIRKTGHFPPSELYCRIRFLGQFLGWLLDGYIVGLVRACFYVTESIGQKNALRFYRQEVWAKLQELAFKAHLSKGQMVELTPTQVATLSKSTVTSRLRFIPKADGMRPITRVMGVDVKTRLYQRHVRDLFDVLRVCMRTTPSLLGSTVWGMTDIHKVLRSLAPAQKEKPQSLFFVKVDVSGAYESLLHSKLIEVVGQALSPVQEEVFTVRHYAKIWADDHEGLKKTFVRQVDFMENNMASTTMKGFVMSLQRESKLHDSILVEQQFSSDLQGKDTLAFFNQMLAGSVVQFGKRKFRQCRGIPQGSVVSSLLCCLCYGHMENILFKDITEKGGCLMRLVDDFLLITPDLHQAQTFLKTLLVGVPDYGLIVNPQKVVVNFLVSGGTERYPGIKVLPTRSLFPWCGLLLDTNTLDVYKDYSSYAGLSLRYSLTLGSSRSAGLQMRRKLMGILRLKCHALFLDLKTNSFEAVYKNIYKLVLLHAYRFHVCAQSLPFGQTVAKNPLYFLQMIWDMTEYSNRLVRLSNKGMSLGSTAQTGVLQYEAVELLFCLSFLRVLSRHRPLYKAMLPHLHKRKHFLERRLGDLRVARVRQASNPSIPEDLMAIHT
ncbi:telomerase reverse transcriptase [Lampris incognitus]|uniref:telomerase reverse transcriptase n=1 Tax=Lampris incognitus TaxID=2546036 RepID=UPI0024B60A2D|nr:telomerase reverse transcriptase [Lampris incognitus]